MRFLALLAVVGGVVYGVIRLGRFVSGAPQRAIRRVETRLRREVDDPRASTV